MKTKAKRPLTNAERQARYREKHMESIEGDKERAQFIFKIGTKKRLERIARNYGYLSATAAHRTMGGAGGQRGGGKGGAES
jgi:hypothetical protein